VMLSDRSGGRGAARSAEIIGVTARPRRSVARNDLVSTPVAVPAAR
jgi:hypothetical protein